MVEVKTNTVEFIKRITTKTATMHGFIVELTETDEDGDVSHSIAVTRNDGMFSAAVVDPADIQDIKKYGWVHILNRHPAGFPARTRELSKKYSGQKNPVDLFEELCVDGACIIFFNHNDHSFYVSTEGTFFRTVHFDYTHARMDNVNYDLLQTLKNLEQLEDPNLFITTDRYSDRKIQSIPSYNVDGKRTEFIEFNYCIEYKPGEGTDQLITKIKTILPLVPRVAKVRGASRIIEVKDGKVYVVNRGVLAEHKVAKIASANCMSIKAFLDKYEGQLVKLDSICKVMD